jgi:hypothetical protein
MTDDEIKKSVEAFHGKLPEGKPIEFKKLQPGMRFRHPALKTHKLYHIIFVGEGYIQYTNDGWITRVTPDKPLWNMIVQTFK